MVDLNKYLKLDSLPEQDRAAFVASFMQVVYARLADIVAQYVDEKRINELEAVTSQDDPQATLQWFQQHIPNFEQVLDKIIQQESQDLYLKIQALLEAQPEE